MHSLHEFVLQQTATLPISNDSTTDMITSNSQASERFLNGGSILLQTISPSSLRVTERPRECASEVEGPSRKKRRIAHPFNINPRQLEPLLDSIALLLQVNPESKGTTAVAFDLEGSCHGQVAAKDYAIQNCSPTVLHQGIKEKLCLRIARSGNLSREDKRILEGTAGKIVNYITGRLTSKCLLQHLLTLIHPFVLNAIRGDSPSRTLYSTLVPLFQKLNSLPKPNTFAYANPKECANFLGALSHLMEWCTALLTSPFDPESHKTRETMRNLICGAESVFKCREYRRIICESGLEKKEQAKFFKFWERLAGFGCAIRTLAETGRAIRKNASQSLEIAVEILSCPELSPRETNPVPELDDIVKGIMPEGEAQRFHLPSRVTVAYGKAIKNMNSKNARQHAEITLARYILESDKARNLRLLVPYFGVSKPACSVCREFFRSLKSVDSGEVFGGDGGMLAAVYMRGMHLPGRMYHLWGLHSFSASDNKLLQAVVEQMRRTIEADLACALGEHKLSE